MLGRVSQLYMKLPVVCHLSTSAALKQPYNPRDNPGVYRRLKLISEDEPDLERADIDEQSLDDLEQDWMGAAEMHDEAVSEIQSIKRKVDYNIVRHKYFRQPKEPNMLTWSEKEQIRFLHKNDPKQWTAEILAESFPASPAIIKKLLRSKWTPRSAQRLKEHDSSVSDNWVAFHKGKLEVNDPKLKVHLERFQDRKEGVRIISDEDAINATKITFPMPKRTEFLSLVTSFKSENEITTKEITRELECKKHPMKEIEKGDRFALIHEARAHYTLKEFKKRVADEMSNVPNPPEDIRAIMESNSSQDQANSNTTLSYVAPSDRFLPDGRVYEKHKGQLEVVDTNKLANYIKIPKDLREPGKIYKVNDCFYNDRGVFLYRVPGLN